MLSQVFKMSSVLQQCCQFAILSQKHWWETLPENYFKMYTFGKEELADKSACAVQRAELKMCLLMSDCCRKLRKTPRQCLQNPEGMVPNECFLLKTAFYECKRSTIDMRTRFRGIKE